MQTPRQRRFTRQQLLERIQSIADYTDMGRRNFGVKSISYTMQVDMLKNLASIYRREWPNPKKQGAIK